MKNKHLVLLFLAVFVAGFLWRQIPWPLKQVLQADLITVDTARVTQISILQPELAELLLERTDAGWAAAQERRSVAMQPEHIAPILNALSAVRSLRIVKTERPDTLGFSENNRLQVIVYKEKEIVEQFEIGNEVVENDQPATYIRLQRHEGIYLVRDHLRGIFSKNLDSLRLKSVATFDPSEVNGIVVEWWENGLNVQYPVYKNDSTARWIPLGLSPPEIPNDTIQHWLQLFGGLEGSPFADNFDESRARETIISRITLYLTSADSVVFRVFYARPPDLPEEFSMANVKELPVYILHSTQNPFNYFAPPDTLLLRRICFGLIPE